MSQGGEGDWDTYANKALIKYLLNTQLISQE